MYNIRKQITLSHNPQTYSKHIRLICRNRAVVQIETNREVLLMYQIKNH